jgi:hypothetical protein
MDELQTLDELIEDEGESPAEDAAPGGPLLAEANPVGDAALGRLRELLLAADPAVDPALVSGDSVEALEESFVAARAMVARVRDAVRREQAAAIPVGAPGRTATMPASPLEKIRAGLAR